MVSKLRIIWKQTVEEDSAAPVAASPSPSPAASAATTAATLVADLDVKTNECLDTQGAPQDRLALSPAPSSFSLTGAFPDNR